MDLGHGQSIYLSEVWEVLMHLKISIEPLLTGQAET